jgi:glycosyltransferase involved in cell wall biosynthesis
MPGCSVSLSGMQNGSSVSPPAADRPRVALVQDGSRRRFAVPRTLARAGMLEAMYIDFFIRPGSKEQMFARLLARLKPSLARNLESRRADDIPPERVVCSSGLFLRLRRGARHHSPAERYYNWAAEETGRWIQRKGLRQANILMGYVRNLPPDLCRHARERGIVTVADQMIATAATERAQTGLQYERFPDWEHRDAAAWDFVEDIERRTLANLDCVTSMSEFVSESLVASGFPADKIALIRYPFDTTGWTVPDRAARTTVTVGFVGSVLLRKGVQYLREVAKNLAGRNIKFVLVGNVHLTDTGRRLLAEHVELTGPVPRAQVRDWLNRFDIFCFPSTCEGSAGAVVEAMATGLPVVTSPNSGSLARDGIEGFVQPYDDVATMTDRIDRLASDAGLRQSMGRAARARVEAHNFAWYQSELEALFGRLLAAR